MNISGIRIQAGFYDYNTIKNTQIQEESVPNVIDTAGEDTRVAEVTESERDNKPDHGATESERNRERYYKSGCRESYL